MHHCPNRLVSRAGISALVIFAAFSGACGGSDNPDDPFSGNSGGSASQPATAGRNGVAGSPIGSGGQLVGAGGSGAGGSTPLPSTGGSATSGGSFGTGGFVTGFGGTSETGAGGRSFGSGGRSFGSGGSGGRSFGSGGSAGQGQSSAGAGGASSPTWTEIYTKYLTNDAYASNCNGSACHNPGKQKGYDFSSKANGYTSVKNNTSQFVSELSSGGMPKGKPKMPAADLALIKAWVAAGALNN